MKSNLDLKGELLGYIDMDCPRCNRHRVEKYENGELRVKNASGISPCKNMNHGNGKMRRTTNETNV